MPQEPKRRHSVARKGKRRAHIHLDVPQSSVCPNCGADKLSHTVCPSCGMYKGRKIV